MKRTKASHPREDLTTTLCEVCGEGYGRVCYWGKRDLFFWGCSFSTLEAPCARSSWWQHRRVPETLEDANQHLRLAYLTAQMTDKEKKQPTKKRAASVDVDDPRLGKTLADDGTDVCRATNPDNTSNDSKTRDMPTRKFGSGQ